MLRGLQLAAGFLCLSLVGRLLEIQEPVAPLVFAVIVVLEEPVCLMMDR